MQFCLACLSLVLAAAAPTPPIVPGAPISPDTPWAVAPADGPRTYYESLFGEGYDPTLVEPIRDGNLVFDGESLAWNLLEEQGLPLPALDHEPTPGILYLAMDGVTLSPKCKGGQIANAALNCSPLVSKETTFPKPPGGEATKAVVLQKMQNFFGAYDLVLTTERPPEYLPYTMAVIGGTSGNAGQPNGVCGIANVSCDGAKRNHVSLSFPDSCVGVTAEIAAQEAAHNWGLEHTDVTADLMYPFLAGGNSFRDECMDISHETGNGITACTYVHKLYCPEGQGEQQNSHTELLGVFGPRQEDTTAPEIVNISPPDGSTFTDKDAFLVTADIVEDSNFVGVKWTWLEGLPPDLAEKGYTRCTNQVCTDDFAAWRPVDEPWPFLNINKPPPGTYRFQIEVMDAYGNSDTETITITVVPSGGTTTDEPDPTGEPDPTTGPSPTTDDPTTSDDSSDAGSSGNISSATQGTPMDDPGGDDGCACRTRGAPSGSWLLLLAGLLPLRRRARRADR